ncbi:MAG TPA: LuxR C-terminal-related transcriptional regulator [Streptosporangiaceae bacterium]|jgi:predicted ATPase/DNA-binding CsgD family transcriptional regulator|nr:LuxR C-terminal-related transcriptional regulator [Streptosporangiaceae bacterium]
MTAQTAQRLGNLPAEPNSFVGRERDLGDLRLLLSNVRALTLCGPGGIGKTRLATRLGWQLGTEFPDGVWLVEFADSADPALAARQVATVLGIGDEPDRPAAATIADALRNRQLLLILDTCEHVVEAVADLVRDLIAACPLLRLVATSREPLRVRGETVWRVPPLSLPSQSAPGFPPPPLAPPTDMGAPAEYEAIRLFVDRAAAVRPGFTLTRDNREHVVQVCRMLDGVPLAIELAAARIRALSVEQIAGRIDDRFRLLASGDRTAPPRQQTLQAAVDWSFDLLTDDEQMLLRRLSVFAGWSLEMAEQVCADERIPEPRVLDLLAALIDKSLVGLEDERAGDARYRLLDTIREYAAARLTASGEQKELRHRHAQYMLGLAEAVVAQAFLRNGQPWSQQVQMYYDIAGEQANFRSALAFCLDIRDAENGLRLCSALRSPWVVQGDVAEGVSWFGRFLALDEWVPAGVRARALMLGAELAFEHQDYPGAARTAQAAVAMCTAYAAACPAGGLRILALISLRAGLADEALARADAAIAAARQHGDEWEEGLAESARATILARGGRLADAQSAFEVALDLLTGNNGWGVAHALYGFGSLARARRDNAGALRHFRSALEIFRQIGARTEMARCLAGIGWVALASFDVPTAAASLAESLDLSMATGQRLGIARGLEAVATLAVVRGDDVTAVRLEGAATTLREVVGQVRSAAAQARFDSLLAAAHHRLGSGAPGLLAEGRRLGTHEAVSYALASASAAAAAAANGQDAQADPAAAASRPEPGAAPVLPGRSGPAGKSVLTAREQQIAQLIARGLSNRAIGEELVISPATAARHVANILAKLGLNSRAQVAAWIAEQRPAR